MKHQMKELEDELQATEDQKIRLEVIMPPDVTKFLIKNVPLHFNLNVTNK